MARQGLKIMGDCNDPPMCQTDPTSDSVALVEPMGGGPEDVRAFVLNGIDGSWLDDPTKRRRPGGTHFAFNGLRLSSIAAKTWKGTVAD